MKIIVTGGNGFLGKVVVERLNKAGHETTVLSRKNENCSEGIIKTDSTVKDLTTKLIDHDAVIHLAAKRGSQGKKIEFQDNESLTQNLYDAALANDIKNIVYASTISVYSGEDLLPWTEQTIPIPHLMYGISKLTCEMIGNLYNEKYNVAIKNLRMAHLYGPNEKNNYMINLFFRQAYKKETLQLKTQSSAKREFLYVKDAADAILKAIEYSDKKGTYNVGSNDSFTNEEVAKKINNVFNNKGNLEIQNPHIQDVSKPSSMDNQLSKIELGYSPNYSFDEALQEIFKELKEHENVPIYY